MMNMLTEDCSFYQTEFLPESSPFSNCSSFDYPYSESSPENWRDSFTPAIRQTSTESMGFEDPHAYDPHLYDPKLTYNSDWHKRIKSHGMPPIPNPQNYTSAARSNTSLTATKMDYFIGPQIPYDHSFVYPVEYRPQSSEDMARKCSQFQLNCPPEMSYISSFSEIHAVPYHNADQTAQDFNEFINTHRSLSSGFQNTSSITDPSSPLDSSELEPYSQTVAESLIVPSQTPFQPPTYIQCQSFRQQQKRSKQQTKKCNGPAPRSAVYLPSSAKKCNFEGCEKKFVRQEHLKRHQRTHYNPDSFQCPFCSRTFSRFDNLRAHMKLHDKGGPDRPNRRTQYFKDAGKIIKAMSRRGGKLFSSKGSINLEAIKKEISNYEFETT
ncbi:Bgt-4361 [Blumeria graminis f. sp. tritici]|uniref:Bgt-4361 n=2 Tax=Blumeria graminis f. sp. tritici TaxID=62690 RepID=A0A9X9QEC5_BLUGR|nr:hypothetical protein BGT96224_4361 [Blumeria graminis f. sp. tritici 96224]VDB90345.1 Bgt-4361 [Blumeria graminis f. sp. tritici]